MDSYRVGIPHYAGNNEKELIIMRSRIIILSCLSALLFNFGAVADEGVDRRGERIEPRRSIVGSWEVTVISDDVPGAPAPFLAYFTYDSGEGFVETDPHAGGNGHGYWEKTGRNKIKWRMIRPLYDQQFQLTGSFDVTETIVLTSATEYEGEFVAKLLDPEGNVVAVIPGRTEGRRIELEDEDNDD